MPTMLRPAHAVKGGYHLCKEGCQTEAKISLASSYLGVKGLKQWPSCNPLGSPQWSWNHWVYTRFSAFPSPIGTPTASPLTNPQSLVCTLLLTCYPVDSCRSITANWAVAANQGRLGLWKSMQGQRRITFSCQCQESCHHSFWTHGWRVADVSDGKTGIELSQWAAQMGWGRMSLTSLQKFPLAADAKCSKRSRNRETNSTGSKSYWQEKQMYFYM